jgi:hypothetical protein
MVLYCRTCIATASASSEPRTRKWKDIELPTVPDTLASAMAPKPTGLGKFQRVHVGPDHVGPDPRHKAGF